MWRECKLRKNCAHVFIIAAGKTEGGFHSTLSPFGNKNQKTTLCLAYNTLHPGEQKSLFFLLISTTLTLPPHIQLIHWNHLSYYYIVSVTYKKKDQYSSCNPELLSACNVKRWEQNRNRKDSGLWTLHSIIQNLQAQTFKYNTNGASKEKMPRTGTALEERKALSLGEGWWGLMDPQKLRKKTTLHPSYSQSGLPQASPGNDQIQIFNFPGCLLEQSARACFSTQNPVVSPQLKQHSFSHK